MFSSLAQPLRLPVASLTGLFPSSMVPIRDLPVVGAGRALAESLGLLRGCLQTVWMASRVSQPKVLLFPWECTWQRWRLGQRARYSHPNNHPPMRDRSCWIKAIPFLPSQWVHSEMFPGRSTESSRQDGVLGACCGDTLINTLRCDSLSRASLYIFTRFLGSPPK